MSKANFRTGGKSEETMVELSELNFKKFLGNLGGTVTAPASLAQSSSSDFDILIIHDRHGLVVGEMEVMEDRQMPNMERVITTRLEKAVKVKLLKKGLGHLAPDLATVNIPGTLVLPYLSSRLLMQGLRSNSQTAQALGECLGATTLDDAVSMCLCSDKQDVRWQQLKAACRPDGDMNPKLCIVLGCRVMARASESITLRLDTVTEDGQYERCLYPCDVFPQWPGKDYLIHGLCIETHADREKFDTIEIHLHHLGHNALVTAGKDMGDHYHSSMLHFGPTEEHLILCESENESKCYPFSSVDTDMGVLSLLMMLLERYWNNYSHMQKIKQTQESDHTKPRQEVVVGTAHRSAFLYDLLHQIVADQEDRCIPLKILKHEEELTAFLPPVCSVEDENDIAIDLKKAPADHGPHNLMDGSLNIDSKHTKTVESNFGRHDDDTTSKDETCTDRLNGGVLLSPALYCQKADRFSGYASSAKKTKPLGWNDMMVKERRVAVKEETCLIDYTADHGSARTAVSQDSNHNNAPTISVPVAQQVSDQADPSGDGNHDARPLAEQNTHKALSTVPVPDSDAEEKREQIAYLQKFDAEAKDDVQEKSQNKLENVEKKKADIDGDANNLLERYYSVENVPPQLQRHFVCMMRVGRPLVHQGFENELRRLATFYNFCPPEGVYIIPLANSGFFLPANNSVNSADQRSILETLLECAFCGVAVAVMKFMGRRPMDVHKEVSPGCPFVLGRENRNVSVAQMAQTSGAQFLDTVMSSGANGVSSSHGEGEAPGGQAVLATDGDSATVPTAAVLALPGSGKGNAAEKPVFPGTDTVPVPPQSVTVGHAAVHASGHGGPKPGPQQLPQAGNRLGDTVSDARGIASSLPPSTLQTPPQPRQTATVTQAPSATQTAARTQESSAAPENGEGSRNSTQPSSSPTADTENSAQTGNGQGEGTQERQVVTYEQLGIFAQRPKRQDMAVAATRINTFEAWPHADSHPASEMAEAGFYYTGHADLVRCFYCKGGLKTWERSDRPWVEHSRWFPRCPFVRLCKGQKFVDAIQKLNEAGGRPTISEADVKREMLRQEEEERRNRPTTLPPPPPAAPEIQTDSAAGAVGGSTSLRSGFAAGEGNDTEAMARRLEEENQEMKETTLCKMCQTREVNVLFLPCGHLVACAYCAPALRTCAMCRQPVKGTVRVQLDEEETVDV